MPRVLVFDPGFIFKWLPGRRQSTAEYRKVATPRQFVPAHLSNRVPFWNW